jgi:hypothetical protein
MRAPEIIICTSQSRQFPTRNGIGKARISTHIRCYGTERNSVTRRSLIVQKTALNIGAALERSLLN